MVTNKDRYSQDTHSLMHDFKTDDFYEDFNNIKKKYLTFLIIQLSQNITVIQKN